MRILFIATGDIGLPSLEALLGNPEHEVVGLVTQPDKPVGRKMVLTPPKVKERALAAGLPVLQPRRIRQAVAELAAFSADVFVVVAYGQILPKSILDLPKIACLNIHASLLPRHRGAAPIQAAIREGDAESGIAIMWMDEGLDTGDVLLMEKTPILPSDTGGVLHDRLAEQAPACLTQALQLLVQGKATRSPQNHEAATYCGKLDRAQGRLLWEQEAVVLERLIRAYQPWPGTFCQYASAEGRVIQLKVHAAQVADAVASDPPGTVRLVDSRLLVSCGAGLLELTEVQMEGKKRMAARDFLHGHAIREGLVLG